MGKVCAYCRQETILTKEHIWPNGFIQRFDKSALTYTKKVNKFFKSDPVVKDVCAICNNVKLSAVDAYLCSLYDNYFHKIIAAGESAKFGYSYDKLLRGLLKISYNSSRTQVENETVINLHSKCSEYILGSGYRPQNVMLRLLVVTSSKMYDPSVGTEKTFEPDFFRCTDIAYDGALCNRFIVRMVAVKSYWFYIIFSKKKENRAKWRQFSECFENWLVLPGIVLTPGNVDLDIAVNQTTYMHGDLLGSLVDAES